VHSVWHPSPHGIKKRVANTFRRLDLMSLHFDNPTFCYTSYRFSEVPWQCSIPRTEVLLNFLLSEIYFCLDDVTLLGDNIDAMKKNTYLLTELSPSWWAANCEAPQELLSILWNPKVQYRVHKSPPLVPILNHINPVHSIPSYISKIHSNIVHPPTSWSSQWSLSFWLSHQCPIHIPLLPHLSI
jgi:hypothetical protein